jgi:hypothetical protein
MSFTRMKILMEKNRLESMHQCYLTTKQHFKAQKKYKGMNFQIRKFLLLFVHLTMHLTIMGN